MGYRNLLTAHGIRSIGATAMYEHGYASSLVEPALSHTSGNQTRDAYDRSKLIELRRPMMEWWSNYIERAKVNGLMGISEVKNV
jgi:integrase